MTRLNFKLTAKLIAALFLLFSILPSLAAEDIQGLPKAQLANDIKFKDAWSFHLSPYLWFPGLSGHVNVRGNHVGFSNQIDQLLHHLDSTIGAHFEASRGNWSLLLDPDYIKITQHPGLRTTNSKTTYETTITDIGAFYNIYSIKMPRADYNCSSVEIQGAGRIITFHTTIDFLNGATRASVSDTSSVVVPILGARLKYNFNPKWHTWLGGDFGGFEVSHVSSTWSGIFGVTYNFTPAYDVSLAYKAMGVNYSIHGITISTMLQGPILAFGYSW